MILTFNQFLLRGGHGDYGVLSPPKTPPTNGGILTCGIAGSLQTPRNRHSNRRNRIRHSSRQHMAVNNEHDMLFMCAPYSIIREYLFSTASSTSPENGRTTAADALPHVVRRRTDIPDDRQLRTGVGPVPKRAGPIWRQQHRVAKRRQAPLQPAGLLPMSPPTCRTLFIIRLSAKWHAYAAFYNNPTPLVLPHSLPTCR